MARCRHVIKRSTDVRLVHDRFQPVVPLGYVSFQLVFISLGKVMLCIICKRLKRNNNQMQTLNIFYLTSHSIHLKRNDNKIKLLQLFY